MITGSRHARAGNAADEFGPLDAWRTLSYASPVLDHAEPLQLTRDKAQVWLLSGWPRAGRVVAKRLRLPEADREALVYTSVLPVIGMSTARYLGRVDAGDGRTAWLFIEQLAGVPYTSDEPLHRDLAAAWLSQLHAKARGAPAAEGLRDVGPAYYRPMLQKLVEVLAQAAHGEASGVTDDEVLNRAAGYSREAVELWPRIEVAVRPLPRTLVHGSFGSRNMLVVPSNGNPMLAVFDWGAAGWGIPARDLTKLVDPKVAASVSVYWRRFPEVAPPDRTLLLATGRLFRSVEHMTWVAPGGHRPSLEDPMRKLAAHSARLAAALDQLRDLV